MGLGPACGMPSPTIPPCAISCCGALDNRRAAAEDDSIETSPHRCDGAVFDVLFHPSMAPIPGSILRPYDNRGKDDRATSQKGSER